MTAKKMRTFRIFFHILNLILVYICERRKRQRRNLCCFTEKQCRPASIPEDAIVNGAKEWFVNAPNARGSFHSVSCCLTGVPRCSAWCLQGNISSSASTVRYGFTSLTGSYEVCVSIKAPFLHDIDVEI